MGRLLSFAALGFIITLVSCIDFEQSIFIAAMGGPSRKIADLMDAILLVLIVLSTLLLPMKSRMMLFFWLSFLLWLLVTADLIMPLIGLRSFPFSELPDACMKGVAKYRSMHDDVYEMFIDFTTVFKFFLLLCGIMYVVLGIRKVYQKYVLPYIRRIYFKKMPKN